MQIEVIKSGECWQTSKVYERGGNRGRIMQIVEKNINELTPYENNPRKNDKSVDYVANSISQFGFKVPIVIDSNGVIVAGHTRYKAAVKLKMDTVPCIIADDLSDEQIKAFRLADNKVGEFSEWDFNLLNVELDGILDLDMSDFGFDLNIDEEEVKEDDFDEEPPKNPITKRGNIYKLGNHYLMCGDSTNKDDVKKLLKGIKTDLAFCDPPYDMDNDTWIENLDQNKKGAPIILMAADKQTARLVNKIPNFRHFLVHNRVRPILSNASSPMSQHTIISLFCDHPSKYFVNLHDCFTTIIECEKDYKKAKDDMQSKMGKPIKVISQMISHYSKKENVILDLFGGGGSVMIACEQLNRICYCMELDEGQCDLIVQRWEEFTGKKAELIT